MVASVLWNQRGAFTRGRLRRFPTMDWGIDRDHITNRNASAMLSDVFSNEASILYDLRDPYEST
jgi:hypothetical protein